jgi:hypothetical protein
LGDDAATGAQTLLFKFEPGGFYPEHDHPTGEGRCSKATCRSATPR